MVPFPESIDTFRQNKPSDTENMTNTNGKSSPATLAIGAVAISIVACILFFLHGASAIPQSLHLWLSGIFVTSVVLHILLNRKQFT